MPVAEEVQTNREVEWPGFGGSSRQLWIIFVDKKGATAIRTFSDDAALADFLIDWSEWRDSNSRPLPPEDSALPG